MDEKLAGIFRLVLILIHSFIHSSIHKERDEWFVSIAFGRVEIYENPDQTKQS